MNLWIFSVTSLLSCNHSIVVGIFNVADNDVSLAILVEWRHLFRCGVPLSTAIEGKLVQLQNKVVVFCCCCCCCCFFQSNSHAGLVSGRNLPSCACRVTAVFNVALEYFSKWPL